MGHRIPVGGGSQRLNDDIGMGQGLSTAGRGPMLNFRSRPVKVGRVMMLVRPLAAGEKKWMHGRLRRFSDEIGPFSNLARCILPSISARTLMHDRGHGHILRHGMFVLNLDRNV